MPFNQLIILKIPTVILGIAIVALAVIMSVAGLLVVRRLVPHHKLKLHNDVAGPIFATLGVVYAVLLAFVVVIVWESFDKSKLNVEKEANCISDLYMDAEVFSADFKTEVRGLLTEYTDVIVKKEWPAMAKGDSSPEANTVLKKIWVLYSWYSPKTEAERSFFDESVNKLNELGELRRLRLMDAKTGVEPLLWFVLITGGVVTIIFTFIFGAENLSGQLIMAVLLTIIISLILFTILAFDYPFTGDVSISPQPFTQLSAHW